MLVFGGGKMTKSGESVGELIERQKQSEESMVRVVKALEDKVNNAAAKLLLAELRLDSSKHAQICQEILKFVKRDVPEMLWDARIESFVDMAVVKKELERHIKLEEAMLKDVEKTIATTKDEALRLLLSHMAEDEKKHHRNIQMIIRKSYVLAP